MRFLPVSFCVFCVLLVTVAGSSAAAPGKGVDFNRDIRPILSDNCLSCHGPDEKGRMAGLRLDTREGVLGKAPSIVARITHEKKALRMPPVATGRALNEKQIALIKKWVDEGAKWEQHWSYTAPKRPDLPAVKAKTWVRNPIDNFVLAKLEQEGLKPSPEADRATLLRRLSFDLTGLPPTPEEVDAFVRDRSAQAYEKQVERLLKSPHYGERMAVQWMDLSRYADTHGYHIDSHRDMWLWRKWVIDAFNENKPYSEFVVEQLAGDLLPNPTVNQKLATGFNRNHMINFEGGAIPEEYMNEYIMDRVETTANVFMGMTMGCARCHDHKYDPISQKDFYRFFAFFNAVPEKGLDGRKGNAEPMIPIAPPGQLKELDDLEAEIKAKRKFLEDKAVEEMIAAWEPSKLAALPGPVKEGIAAHWEFDGSYSDTSGNYQYGRPLKGEPTFNKGMVNGAVNFTMEDQATLGADVPVEANKPFTIAGWIRPVGEKIESIRILTKLDEAQGRRGWELVTEESYHVPDLKRGARLAFHLINQWPTSTLRVRTKDPVIFGTWTHIAYLYDGSSKAAGLRLLVNGKPAELEVLDDSLNGSIATTAPLTVRGFRGGLDDLRFYKRQIGETEVADLAYHIPAGALLQTSAAKRSKEEKERLRDYFLTHAAPEAQRTAYAQLRALERRKEAMERAIPNTMIMADMEKPRDTFVLTRGDYRNKTLKVDAAVPAALPPLPKDAPANRLGLAKWLIDPSHPLTSRVTVNRFWQNYFGNGIVKTSEDFGSQGEAPSHPELLDWLATEFVRTGWDVKAIERLIVTSATYRQASKVTPQLHDRDPENRLLARMSRFRLPAEFVRDNALAVSGLLNKEVGGRSVYPYQPPGLWEEMAYHGTFSAQVYQQSKGADLYRRSMYTFWKRTVPPAQMVTFDAPDREKCTSRRPTTNTPLQALVLWNDPTYVESARQLATAALRDAGPKPEDRIAFAYRRVLLRKPMQQELLVLKKAAAQQMDIYKADPKAAEKLLKTGEMKVDEQLNRVELAAWTNVVSMILSLDEAITKE
ncbi:MAG: DUF1553 domain-containing protein [Bryobacterales bacterium]|nr:DUF1553 domain-containing protein [Bryobacterales bacterium]